MAITLGIDTGGTFTDAALVELESGSIVTSAKSRTTRNDLSIGIKESILNKEDRLSRDESFLMKNHPVIGSNIIKSVGALERVANVVKHHHEHWDGSGYPDGLKEEIIPLGARIIIIADCFEAMTSDRPYQKAMPKKRAVAEIHKGAGKQFDPKLVTIFNEVLDEILQRDLLVQKTEIKQNV